MNAMEGHHVAPAAHPHPSPNNSWLKEEWRNEIKEEVKNEIGEEKEAGRWVAESHQRVTQWSLEGRTGLV